MSHRNNPRLARSSSRRRLERLANNKQLDESKGTFCVPNLARRGGGLAGLEIRFSPVPEKKDRGGGIAPEVANCDLHMQG